MTANQRSSDEPLGGHPFKPLYQLVYCSRATPVVDDDAVNRIIRSARRRARCRARRRRRRHLLDGRAQRRLPVEGVAARVEGERRRQRCGRPEFASTPPHGVTSKGFVHQLRHSQEFRTLPLRERLCRGSK